MNLQDITLQSTDGVLVATNTNGHLVYPMLHLDRQPTPEDAQGFDRVLIFVDGDERRENCDGCGQFVFPTALHLNEDNDYLDFLCIHTEFEWMLTAIDLQYIQLSPGQLRGTGDIRFDVEKAEALVAPGFYETQFLAALPSVDDSETAVQVYLTVNLPLMVNDVSSGEAIWIYLNTSNNFTQSLTIVRDRRWSLTGVNPAMIDVSPTAGDGNATITVTSTIVPGPTQVVRQTVFRVVSFRQWVDVHVHLTIPAAAITGEFVDPRPGEVGVTGSEPVYIFI